MAQSVIRDADDMMKFASSLGSYEEGVKALCDKLQNELADAEQFMSDANSLKALSVMGTTFEDIKGSVPDCSALAERLKRSAGFVREASETVRGI